MNTFEWSNMELTQITKLCSDHVMDGCVHHLVECTFVLQKSM